MSGKRQQRKTDRRVMRTREALGDAIIEIMQEKPFEKITVAELLQRAQVSRSTFYEHFRDKNDLFFSDADEFFSMMSNHLARRQEASNRVAPVQEMLWHVKSMGQFLRALAESGKIDEVMELGQAHMAKGIEGRLRAMPAGRRVPSESLAVKSQALAGAFRGLMMFWIRGGMRGSPAEMDQLFHQLVWCGVAGDAKVGRGAPAQGARAKAPMV